MRRVVCNPLLPSQAMACATAHCRYASSTSIYDVMAAIRALDAKISAVDAKSSAEIDEKLAARFSKLSAEMKAHKEVVKEDATYWASKKWSQVEFAFGILLLFLLFIYKSHVDAHFESKMANKDAKAMLRTVTVAMPRSA